MIEQAGWILTLDVNNPRIIYASILAGASPLLGVGQRRPGQRAVEIDGRRRQLDRYQPQSGAATGRDPGEDWAYRCHLPQPSRVWAIVEAEGEKSGVYRSDDRGASWEHLTNNQDLLNRPWYYLHIFADPQDPDTVYVNNLKMWKSIDGGKEWSEITTPHGDNHDLWIDPADPQRMINGNDGGACVSFNGGETWSTIYNQLTGQYYHLDVDNQQPYHVYGTQQDNSSIAVPSATEKGGDTLG